MHGAGNQHIGESGVEAVVRMATTTPALKTLDLQSECVRGRWVVRGAAVLTDGLNVHQAVA